MLQLYELQLKDKYNTQTVHYSVGFRFSLEELFIMNYSASSLKKRKEI